MLCIRIVCCIVVVFMFCWFLFVNCLLVLMWIFSFFFILVIFFGYVFWRRGRGLVDILLILSGGLRIFFGFVLISLIFGILIDLVCFEFVVVIVNYLFKLFIINLIMNWFILILNYINFYFELIFFSCELFILWIVLFLDSLC